MVSMVDILIPEVSRRRIVRTTITNPTRALRGVEEVYITAGLGIPRIKQQLTGVGQPRGVMRTGLRTRPRMGTSCDLLKRVAQKDLHRTGRRIPQAHRPRRCSATAQITRAGVTQDHRHALRTTTDYGRTCLCTTLAGTAGKPITPAVLTKPTVTLNIVR